MGHVLIVERELIGFDGLRGRDIGDEQPPE